jgi:hypothetical protein
MHGQGEEQRDGEREGGMHDRAQTQGHRFLKPKESRPLSGPQNRFSAPQCPTSGSHILLSRPLIVFSGPRRPWQNFKKQILRSQCRSIFPPHKVSVL